MEAVLAVTAEAQAVLAAVEAVVSAVPERLGDGRIKNITIFRVRG